MKRVVIAGAGGRDFHTFNVVFRDDPGVDVVAFTAAQIPNIDRRTYPPDLAGDRYPAGIPIVPQAELDQLIRTYGVDEVVFAYSDIADTDVMHLAARVIATGADFRLVGQRIATLRSRKPVVAVCATRSGAGKSQTSRAIAHVLQAHGLVVALIRHPMPYGNLHDMRVQRFRTLDDIDASHPTIEEREEYELPVRQGIPVYAGVDYADVVALAEQDADVLLWDGGNNDLPFLQPDVMIVVADALRPGHELAFHPGEANVLLADVLVVNKIDSVPDGERPAVVDGVVNGLRRLNPRADIVLASSPVTLDAGPSHPGQAGARDRGRPHGHSRGHAVRRGLGRCPGPRRPTRRSSSLCGRLPARGVRDVPASRPGAARHGLQRAADRRPGGNHRRHTLRRGAGGHADRPGLGPPAA